METLFLAILLSRCDLDLVFALFTFGSTDVSIGIIENITMIALGVISFLRMTKKQQNSMLYIWGPYLTFSLISLTYTSDILLALKLLMVTLTSAAAFGVSMVIARVWSALFMPKIIVFAAAIPIIVGFAKMGLVQDSEDRLASTFTHPNIFAFFLVAALYALMRIFAARWVGVTSRTDELDIKLGIYCAVSLAAVLVLLIASGCRSGWFVAIYLLGIYGFVVDKRFLLPLAIVPFLLLVPAVNDRLSDILTPDSQPVTLEDITKGGIVADSYSWRKALWRAAMEDYQTDPWFGKGLGAFRNNQSVFFPVNGGGEGGDAHSVYVQTLYELGIAGLAAYLWIYLAIALNIAGSAKSRILSLGFLIANLLIGYSDNILFYLSFEWYTWSLIGFELGLSLSSESAFRKLGPALERSPMGASSATRSY